MWTNGTTNIETRKRSGRSRSGLRDRPFTTTGGLKHAGRRAREGGLAPWGGRRAVRVRVRARALSCVRRAETTDRPSVRPSVMMVARPNTYTRPSSQHLRRRCAATGGEEFGEGEAKSGFPSSIAESRMPPPTPPSYSVHCSRQADRDRDRTRSSCRPSGRRRGASYVMERERGQCQKEDERASGQTVSVLASALI